MLTNEEKCESNAFPIANYASDYGIMKDSFEECANGTKEHSEENHLERDVACSKPLGLTCLSSQLASPVPARDYPVDRLAPAMLANSSNTVLDASRKSNLNCSTNDNKNESALSLSGLNAISGDPRDKIWSLIESVNSEEFSSQPFGDSMNPNFSGTRD